MFLVHKRVDLHSRVIPDLRAYLIGLHKRISLVFTKESDENIPDKGPCPHPSMENIIISPDGVNKLLKGLDCHKATGPDDIHVPAHLLKILADELTPVLTTSRGGGGGGGYSRNMVNGGARL